MNPDKAYRELYQYEKDLQEKGLYPIKLPLKTWQAIKIPLEGAVKYAPSGSIAQVRVHNYCEPFKHPALRIEILGVSPNSAPVVLSRYEVEDAPLEFANELFDTSQTFNYIPDNSEDLISPWTVVYLQEISYTERSYRSDIYDRKTHILRKEGLYFMLPCF